MDEREDGKGTYHQEFAAMVRSRQVRIDLVDRSERDADPPSIGYVASVKCYADGALSYPYRMEFVASTRDGAIAGLRVALGQAIFAVLVRRALRAMDDGQDPDPIVAECRDGLGSEAADALAAEVDKKAAALLESRRRRRPARLARFG